MKFPKLDYVRPGSVAEATRILRAAGGDAKVIAGGQSLLPMLAFRLLAPSTLVDIGGIEHLRAIDVAEDGVRLGALVRWRDIETSAALAREQPLLSRAVEHVAHYQIRNRGTVGGSLAHADPAAELPAVTLACNAAMEVEGPDGRRTIPADDFFEGPMTTALSDDEIIVALALPRWPAGRVWAFREFARRSGDYALAGVALVCDLDADGAVHSARIAGFGVADTAVRLVAAETALVGERPDGAVIARAAAEAAGEVDPLHDPQASADYRRHLLATLLARSLRDAFPAAAPLAGAA